MLVYRISFSVYVGLLEMGQLLRIFQWQSIGYVAQNGLDLCSVVVVISWELYVDTAKAVTQMVRNLGA